MTTYCLSLFTQTRRKDAYLFTYDVIAKRKNGLINKLAKEWSFFTFKFRKCGTSVNY